MINIRSFIFLLFIFSFHLLYIHINIYTPNDIIVF